MKDIDMSCPTELDPYKLAYEMEMDIKDDGRYMQGIYNRHALLSTVGNMFSTKSKHEYPDKPLYKDIHVESSKDNTELTEEEIKQKRINLAMALNIAAANSRIKKKRMEAGGNE